MFFGGGGGDPFAGMGGMGGGGGRSRKPAETSRLYEILGVNKGDDASTIKKAYRKLAIKKHPDKGGDPAEFQELQQAYSVLSDESKRKMYDQHGMEGLEQMEQRGGGRGERVKKGKSTEAKIKVTLEQLYNGQTKNLKITRKTIDKASMKTCGPCGGQGVTIQEVQMGPFRQRAQAPCRDCGGQGRSFREQSEASILEVHIPKGAPNSHKVKFADKGNEIPDGEAGDVVIELEEKPHELFKRKGDDLYVERTISLSDALCGFAMEITHLDGRKLLIQTAPGDVVRPVTGYDPLADEDAEGASLEWEERENTTLGDAIESVARADSDDVDVCKKAVQGQLKGRGIGAFVIENGKAEFKSCTRTEALGAAKSRRGARLFVVKDKGGDAAARMMKAVEGQGMPRLKHPFSFGNLFVMLNVEFPKPGSITPAVQAALLEAVPRLQGKPRPEWISDANGAGADEEPPEDIEVFALSNIDPKQSYEDNKPQPDNDDDDEEGQGGGGGVQCAQQ